MGILASLGTTSTRQGAISKYFRGKRFRLLEEKLSRLPRPIRILDIGGTEYYWRFLGVLDSSKYQVTMLNLDPSAVSIDGFSSIAGNACDLSSVDPGDFDMVHSNSVIEHLFTLGAQSEMAESIRSLGLPYWVQTPNYYFPVEPHFHWLGWQWYPRWLRIAMLRRVRCGTYGIEADRMRAARLVDEVRLLSASELMGLFPGSTLFRERIGPFTKSLVVYRGF